jgi:transmembrane sensor
LDKEDQENPMTTLHLYQKYLENKCNQEELQELLYHFEHIENYPEISMSIRKELEQSNPAYERMPQVEAILSKLDDHIEHNVMKNKSSRLSIFKRYDFRYWAAAVFFLIFSTATYYASIEFNIFNGNRSEYKNDVAPGSDKALLTLANGKKIELTNSLHGTVAAQAGVIISKTGDGQLRYHFSAGKLEKLENGYNTISTPRGGKYTVELSDGTLVFLNAASSLSFPAGFDESGVRRVVLKGEAYFEVAHRPTQPFYVQSGDQQIKVLGTHFNVNAYADEKTVKSTLFQGMVGVSYPRSKSVVLKPGEQSYLDAGELKVSAVDTAEVLDWKHGTINLKEESFQATMRKISRWYDVEVLFDEHAPTDLKLGGLVSREKSLITVLKAMELTGEVHFKVDGRRVTVMK